MLLACAVRCSHQQLPKKKCSEAQSDQSLDCWTIESWMDQSSYSTNAHEGDPRLPLFVEHGERHSFWEQTLNTAQAQRVCDLWSMCIHFGWPSTKGDWKFYALFASPPTLICERCRHQLWCDCNDCLKSTVYNLLLRICTGTAAYCTTRWQH